MRLDGKLWRSPWFWVALNLGVVSLVAVWTLQTNHHAGLYSRADVSMPRGLAAWADHVGNDFLRAGYHHVERMTRHLAVVLLGTAVLGSVTRRWCRFFRSMTFCDVCAFVGSAGHAAVLLYVLGWSVEWGVDHHLGVARWLVVMAVLVAWAGLRQLRALRQIAVSFGPSPVQAMPVRTSMGG